MFSLKKNKQFNKNSHQKLFKESTESTKHSGLSHSLGDSYFSMSHSSYASLLFYNVLHN